MSVQTKAGIHIPTTSECEKVLGKTNNTESWSTWEEPPMVFFNCAEFDKKKKEAAQAYYREHYDEIIASMTPD